MSFPIVGVGASAGGLEAFTGLLSELPSDTGMAFVLIQHLDPNHPSFLSETLLKTTRMTIHEIEDGMRVKPNRVYVIPSGSDIGILHGQFTLLPRAQKRTGLHMPINFFFKGLSADLGPQAIGVVLSGTANDGTEGLKAIRAEGGVTLVQDPRTAKFQGMPQSAVDAGVADLTLTIPHLAQELMRLSRHPFISTRRTDLLSSEKDASGLQKVFVLLRNAVGVDFSEYKSATIKRRLTRRMAVLRTETLDAYIKFLQETPSEAKALCEEVLIHVTSFFRDPQVFEHLQAKAFPAIMKHKKPGDPVRVWVTGCSSGEEVYSVAISLLEFLGEKFPKTPVQIFGSDVSEKAIETARTGFYRESSLRDINPGRLNRFFVKVEDGYQISKLVREVCVFVKHDLARDPPFSRLDLVSCRNVLIYFDLALQKRVISTFHYCLNMPGFLLLGRTENVLSQQHFFSAADKVNKIFARSGGTSLLTFPAAKSGVSQNPAQRMFLQYDQPVFDMTKQTDSILLGSYAPPGVVVNERGQILQYRGKTGPYFEAPPGSPQTNLMKMVRDGLSSVLKQTFVQAKEKMTTVRSKPVVFQQDVIQRKCRVVTIPMAGSPNAKEQLFLVLFEEPERPIELETRQVNKKCQQKSGVKAAKLEHELKATKEYIHSLNDENQRANEALSTVNEELVSGNEELQSMNEELETAKEELQSTNEELTTVNDELQNRNQEVSRINDDLLNLLNSVEIPILILDLEHRIRRFTPKARAIMNLLPGDVGRSIEDIKLNLRIDNLDQQIAEVISTLATREAEVQDMTGRWHRLQIRPYKTSDNKIDGVVVCLVDVDALRRAVKDAEWSRDYATSIVEAVQTPLVVLDEKISIISAVVSMKLESCSGTYLV